MHETTILKLITGETLICEMSYTKDEKYVLIKNPLRFSLSTKQSGSSLIASKWIESNQNEFKLKTWHIVAAAEPTEYIEEIYHESIADLEAHENEQENIQDDDEIDQYLNRMLLNVNDDFNVH
jgi:hypothetical protein